MPIEGDPVIGHLEVRLTQQLLASRGGEQLQGRLHQSRVFAEPKQRRLHPSRPDDPLNHHRTVAARLQDEERPRVVASLAEPLGLRIETLESSADLRHLGRSEQPPKDEEAASVEGLLLRFVESGVHPFQCTARPTEGEKVAVSAGA